MPSPTAFLTNADDVQSTDDGVFYRLGRYVAEVSRRHGLVQAWTCETADDAAELLTELADLEPSF